ncbi:xanthine dehydrogenase molybdopterin binding subunit [bacterium]|nr:MAG: xanthine dehydrogenase molybdopterin binding subunit [bacterium]
MPSVGRSIPHESSRDHVRGRSIFLDDIPPHRNELLVDFVSSPVARGEIVALDLSAAAKLPGVVGLYTFRDVPGDNLFGPIFNDEHFLAEDKVCFQGEPIVVIAAESHAALKAAKVAIRLEVRAETPVVSIEQAIEAGEFIGTPRAITRGDAADAVGKALHRLEGTIYIGGQEHFYMETQCALAIPGENGHLTFHSSTQNPTETQVMAARVLGLGMHQVVCLCKRMGGGFGGKETQATPPALMAGLVALKTGRPARCIYAREADGRVTGKRHPFEVRYQVGFDDDGHLLGARLEFYSNAGSSADLSTSVFDRALYHADNAYFIPDIELIGRVCRTNLPSNTAFRGFGGGQGIMAIESVIEDIAEFLGKDAAEIRLINCYGADGRNQTPYGQIVQDDTLPLLFERLVERANYWERRRAIDEFNATSQSHLRGLSLTTVKFGISFTTKFLNQANALVNVYTDGTIQVSTGGTEMGQGLNTKIRQLVADEFAVDPANISVMSTSTEKNNNTPPTAASAGTDLNGSAAVNACRLIRERLTEFAASRLSEGEPIPIERVVWENGCVFDSDKPEQSIEFGKLVHAAHRERISLGERGHYITPGLGPSRPFFYYTTGCALAEVEIDRFTGEMRVTRADVLMDIGQSINPAIDLGQIGGGFVQGMGWATCEELKFSDEGELLTASPSTYKIPGVRDIPEDFRIEFVEDSRFPENVRSSKAVGEPPLLLGLCVWTAIKNALSYAGSKGQSAPLNLPATGEEILRCLSEMEEV